ncbi:D-amino acid aminotransferase [Thiomicrospira sp. WB1]|uniref:D-amino acid aminotransferase n=1 Tax=Thiomicrospira sp. WB1 TaxID=1685380 RepID=UPI00074616D3|nr:D-amino acid aminotransferase [Thiomicrospira sp. WB1]KUJ71548.1 D-amino acid aminotransferase [Thiomicrospira sp. WB1]
MAKSSGQFAYLNGDFLPLEKCRVSPQDRGFLFGDGVYEVIPVFNGTPFKLEAHLNRLSQSLDQSRILNPMDAEQWQAMLTKLISYHPWPNQVVYLQVTRGTQMRRDHLPDPDLSPTLYAYASELKSVNSEWLAGGLSVVTLPDDRWQHCNIKAITLLPNILLKLQAQDQGADDAILYREDGLITEGTASNVFVVAGDQVSTPPLSDHLLAGVTRQVVIELAQACDLRVCEQLLTRRDLDDADEIWLTSSTKNALPVTQLNHQPVGNGQPGPIWQKLNTRFEQIKQAWPTSLTD